jgi:hypothetical protein
VAREVADVTGAGDTVVATLALALAAGATLAEAAILANHAAGIVVGKFGPATLTRGASSQFAEVVVLLVGVIPCGLRPRARSRSTREFRQRLGMLPHSEVSSTSSAIACDPEEEGHKTRGQRCSSTLRNGPSQCLAMTTDELMAMTRGED